MNIKLIILSIVISAVILSGCTGNNATDVKINDTVNETVNNKTTINETTSDLDGTVSNETEDKTVNEEQPLIDASAEKATQGPKVIDTGLPRTYTIRLEKFLSSPNNLVVAPQDTVFWINFNDPVRAFTLVSENGLWENQVIGYRQSFSYTFNETGTYNYSIVGFPRMNGTIIVK
ncbi:MAG: hypothetical protein H5T43_05885 [Methanomethylovorans sp.]|jgi:plastocyanin|nr:hypothetical protein [Methanomethylovorans sp.]